jgi:hypothetical protein
MPKRHSAVLDIIAGEDQLVGREELSVAIARRTTSRVGGDLASLATGVVRLEDEAALVNIPQSLRTDT